MQQTCCQCSAAFEIAPDDLAFYESISPLFNGKKELIPPPTLCPDCRQQRKFAFRNERHLYARTCDATGKSIISTYTPDVPFPVYTQEYWWNDQWNPQDFGLPWNPKQSFFAQFDQLLQKTPRFACTVSTSENCDYNNFCAGSRNCYMSQRLGDAEDSYYSYLVIDSRSICDAYNAVKSELCYETVDANGCYNTRFSENVVNCTDSSYLFNCNGCRNCCLCINLRNAEYCFENKKLTKEEYEKRVAALRLVTASGTMNAGARLSKLKAKSIVPALWGNTLENVSGNYLSECKNVLCSFDCHHCEDVRYAWGHMYGEDCMDTAFGFHCNRCYEFAAGVRSQDLHFCFNILNTCHDLFYCIDCVNSSHDLFGCISVKHGEYCILNKQYTKEEYERLVPQIIEKMRADGEWGEFFPVIISPFAYNETAAQEYFPLKRKEVEKLGWKWMEKNDDLPKVTKVIPAKQLPDSIDDIPDDIVNWAIECEATKRPFKIIKQELEFYRKMQLPIPHCHPDERHRRRMALRNPRKLWTRPCMKCGKEMQTTYSPERPETVYCEECYLKEVY
jgi:hypothetical protein